jgi:hypothetical protein
MNLIVFIIWLPAMFFLGREYVTRSWKHVRWELLKFHKQDAILYVYGT